MVIVKLLNGKSGKPIARIRVYIALGDPKDQKLLDLKTDQQGEVQFEAKDARTFQVIAVGTVPCGEQPIGAPGRDYPIEEVLKMGIVTANDCSARKFDQSAVKFLTLLVLRRGWNYSKISLPPSVWHRLQLDLSNTVSLKGTALAVPLHSLMPYGFSR